MDIARQEAISNCKTAAAHRMQTSIVIKSTVIQTEKDSAVHEETKENFIAANLDCLPERDEVEYLQGSVKFWIKCRFDLKAIKSGPIPANEQGHPNSDAIAANPSAVSVRQVTPAEKPIQSSRRRLLISTIPACREILIGGPKARIQRCDANPVALTVEPEDVTLTVRAVGHMPKVITIKQGEPANETINVILDPQ